MAKNTKQLLVFVFGCSVITTWFCCSAIHAYTASS